MMTFCLANSTWRAREGDSSSRRAGIWRVVVIADGDRQYLLGFVLFDDVAVEIGLDVARAEVEIEHVGDIGGFIHWLILIRTAP